MKQKNYLAIFAKSFNWAGFFLPKKIYNDCAKLYAFCRVLDDIADEKTDLESKIKRFNKMRIFLKESYDTKTKEVHSFNESEKNIHDDIIIVEEVVTTETISKNNSHINVELGFPILFDQGAFQNLGDVQFSIEPTLSVSYTHLRAHET